MATTAPRRKAALNALGAFLGDGRHPLTPAAIRVERSSARGDHADAHQTALTVWFGEGPALPAPSAARPQTRALVGAVAGIAGVLALGALGVLAQREPRALAAPPAIPRLPAP